MGVAEGPASFDARLVDPGQRPAVVVGQHGNRFGAAGGSGTAAGMHRPTLPTTMTIGADVA